MCRNHQKPIILCEGKNTLADLEKLKKSEKIWKISDLYDSQLKELFEITNPHLKGKSTYAKKPEKGLMGNWIYFPWSGELVHTVKKDDYDLIRTNRNKNLITAAEQKKLADFTVGIVGLSVGSHAASNLAYGGLGIIKLAEHDSLDTSNLNRIRAGLGQVGKPKIDITAQSIYEINPYARLTLFCDGLNEKNLADFINKTPKPKLIFEIIDNFEMKIKLRLAARKAKIPVIMFANLGDSVLVDVERYDQDPQLPLFNGRIGNLPEKILEKPDLTDADKNKYAVQIVGPENVPPRALQSVKEIGKTLVGRPQLMSTVAIGGGLAAYLARRIALGESVSGGRRVVKFENFL